MKSHIQKLVLVFDVSGSIGKMVAGSLVSRLEWLKAEALRRVACYEREGIGAIEVYTLKDADLRPCAKRRTASQVVEAIQADPHASTYRWDALGSLCGNRDRPLQHAHVVLLTDADLDHSSNFDCQSVAKRLESQGSRLEVVEAPDVLMSGMLGLSTDQDCGVEPQVENLTDCDTGLIELVRECVVMATLFLRDRMHLEYQPVTTVLVDEATVLRNRPRTPGDGFANDPDLLYDLCEMLRLLQGTCLAAHVSRPQKDWSNRDAWNFSQYIVTSLIHSLDAPPSDAPFLIGGEDVNVDDALRVMDEVDDWLKNGAPELAWDMRRVGAYFETYGRIYVSGKSRTQFDQNCWRRRFDGDVAALLDETFDSSGMVRKDPRSLALLHCETLAIVKKLFEQLPTQAASPVGSKCRLYGCYIHAPGLRPLAISGKGGRRYEHHSPDSGMVLLALNECKRLADDITAEDENKDEGARQKMLKRVLCDILVHEHAHAIMKQGVSIDPVTGKHQPVIIGEFCELVEEAIAEWLEFEAFRWDPRMLASIRAHAGSSCFPGWPYAGALILEAMETDSMLGLDAMRCLLRHYRSGDTHGARNRLKRWHQIGKSNQ